MVAVQGLGAKAMAHLCPLPQKPDLLRRLSVSPEEPEVRRRLRLGKRRSSLGRHYHPILLALSKMVSALKPHPLAKPPAGMMSTQKGDPG